MTPSAPATPPRTVRGIDAQHAWTAHLDHCDWCRCGQDYCPAGRILLTATAHARTTP